MCTLTDVRRRTSVSTPAGRVGPHQQSPVPLALDAGCNLEDVGLVGVKTDVDAVADVVWALRLGWA